MLKDVRLCLESGQAAGVAVPGGRGRRVRCSTPAWAAAWASADFAAMLEVVEARAGTRL